MSLLPVQGYSSGSIATSELVDPISHWAFDEGTGTAAIDAFYNNNGTIVGAEWITGLKGNALEFDGSDYIEFENDNSLLGMTFGFTIEALFKLSSFGTENGNALIMLSAPTPIAGGLENIFAFWPSNIPNTNGAAIGYVDQYDNYHPIHLDCWLELNQWVLLDVVARPNNELQIFVNGSLICSTSWISPLQVNDLDKLYIGTDIDADGTKTDFFNGIIDEVSIYGEALEPSQIWQNYRELFADTLPDLVAHWDFEEGEGTTAHDLSGNENHGLLVNNPSWTSGIVGGALSFDGQNDYIEIDVSSSLQLLTYEFTIEAFLKIDDMGFENGNCLFMMSAPTPTVPSGENILAVWPTNIPNDNQSAMSYYDALGTYHPTYLDGTIELHQWLLFDLVGRASGELELYINGISVDTVSWSPPINGIDISKVFLGTDIDADGSKTDFLNGSMDEVKVYSIGLSDIQVNENFNEYFNTETTTTTTNSTGTGFSSITTIVIVGSGGVIIIVIIVILFGRKEGNPNPSGYEWN